MQAEGSAYGVSELVLQHIVPLCIRVCSSDNMHHYMPPHIHYNFEAVQ